MSNVFITQYTNESMKLCKYIVRKNAISFTFSAESYCYLQIWDYFVY